MTVTEYIKAKNKIIFDATGMILVPDDQIQECVQLPLDMAYDGNACPYCKAFQYCTNCPMYINKKSCPTYFEVVDHIGHSLVSSTTKNEKIAIPLRKLIEQYNKELKYV